MAVEGLNDDDSPLIYGLEFQSRALCALNCLSNDVTSVRFAVGTQSLKNENQVHLLEYSEETNTLSKCVFRHQEGEIWHMCSSNAHPSLLVTCYSETESIQGKNKNHCTLWKFPCDVSTNLIDEDVVASAPLEKVCDLNETSNVNEIGRTAQFQPEDGKQVMLLAENKLLLWDLESHKLQSTIPVEFGSSKSRSNKITTFRWRPHSNCGFVGIASGTSVYSRDLRVKSSSASNSFAWTISNAHGQLVRNLDFNPNAQYYLATCGDDCESRFWDVRNVTKPVVTMLNHSHWVWCIRYNPFHDQLVLTSSSDSRVTLLRVSTIASQPFGHLVDADDEEGLVFEKDKNDSTSKADTVISTFEEHEDSVYIVSWAANDSWIFGSLSYDGRFVLNKVPKAEKFNILF